MGVYTFTMVDYTSPISAARLFKALCIDNHNLVPKVAPQYFKSIELVEGDSTVVGCVKQFNFPEGSPIKSVKNRVDELDVDNLYIKYTSLEVDTTDNKLDYVVYEGKATPLGAGCQFILTGHFHTKGDAVMTEDEIDVGRHGIKKIHEVVGKYLVANPDVCA